jgi:intracellular multiplication protein IcmE
MASRKENLKSLFSNTRTRVIIVFTLIMLVLAIVIGYMKLKSDTNASLSSELSIAPGGIQSIPGVLDPTAQYAKLQEQQNVDQAKQAETSGSSAIPTIIRTQSIGQGVGVIGSQGGVGFVALEREDEGGGQRSLWIQSLQNANCSKSALAQVISQGAQLSDLKAACSCVQLKDNGYTLPDLEQVCACKELKAAGYNARQLKSIGYTAGRLRECGFDACELRNAGFTAQEMKDGGFSDGELKGAGFSDQEIARASGLPDGITAADVRNAGCNADALSKLRQAGVSASAIRRISGCSAEQLKAAGFTAQQLKDAGFSAADLRKAGFTPEQLKAAGYSARDLLNAGFTPAQLAAAGYTNAQIKAGQADLPPGISPADVKNAGCNIDELKREREAGVSATLIKQYAGCSAQALKAAGFTDADLANAGFTPQEINASNTPVSDDAIRAAGCDPNKLKQLFAEGVSATRIKELNGCSAQALKDAGFDARSLIDAGYTPAQLLAAGFSPQEINAAQKQSDDAIKAAGCDPTKLKQLFAAGVSAARIKELNGCSAQALNDAGFSARSLLASGYTPDQLRAAGYTAQEINTASANPISDGAVRAAGCDPAKLRQLFAEGVSAARIKELNGCSAQALKDAGYDAKSLMDAGFSQAQLLAAGFTPQQISDATSPISDNDIHAAGCDPTQLKKLFAEGVSAARIRQLNGCSAQALKDAGFSAK